MTGQRKTTNLGGTGIEHMEQHAFTLLHTDRLALPEHPAVDAEQVVSHLETLIFLRLFRIGRLTHLLQLFEGNPGQHVHWHITAAT